MAQTQAQTHETSFVWFDFCFVLFLFIVLYIYFLKFMEFSLVWFDAFVLFGSPFIYCFPIYKLKIELNLKLNDG